MFRPPPSVPCAQWSGDRYPAFMRYSRTSGEVRFDTSVWRARMSGANLRLKPVRRTGGSSRETADRCVARRRIGGGAEQHQDRAVVTAERAVRTGRILEVEDATDERGDPEVTGRHLA